MTIHQLPLSRTHKIENERRRFWIDYEEKRELINEREFIILWAKKYKSLQSISAVWNKLSESQIEKIEGDLFKYLTYSEFTEKYPNSTHNSNILSFPN
jgi:hypothetical protein